VLVAVFRDLLSSRCASATDRRVRRAQRPFAALVAGNLTLALADASGGGAGVQGARRTAFWSIAAVTALVLASALFLPPVAALFKFAPPEPALLASALAAALVAGGWPALAGRLAARSES
jgi:Ca2+-transporting ATPase